MRNINEGEVHLFKGEFARCNTTLSDQRPITGPLNFWKKSLPSQSLGLLYKNNRQ